MSQQGIYVGLSCYCTKLENLTFNYCKFCHLQDLWLKGHRKMHFLQVECKSSSRLGADPDLQLREAKLCSGGLGAEDPKGSRGKAPGQGSGGRSRSVTVPLFTYDYSRPRLTATTCYLAKA